METTIVTTAHELALKFQDDTDIPERFKKIGADKKKKPDTNSFIEKRFQNLVKGWENTIRTIINHASNKQQAWRFIKIVPKIPDTSINSITNCQDFVDFTDLFVKRRDEDQCGDEKLGNLSKLHSAFQKEIGRVINDPLS